MRIETFVKEAQPVLDLVAEEYLAAFVALYTGDVLKLSCSERPAELLGAIRIACHDLLTARPRERTWIRVDIGEPPRPLRVFFMPMGPSVIIGVVAEGDGPPLQADASQLGDLGIANAFFESIRALLAAETPPRPVPFGSDGSGPSSSGAADFAGFVRPSRLTVDRRRPPSERAAPTDDED